MSSFRLLTLHPIVLLGKATREAAWLKSEGYDVVTFPDVMGPSWFEGGSLVFGHLLSLLLRRRRAHWVMYAPDARPMPWFLKAAGSATASWTCFENFDRQKWQDHLLYLAEQDLEQGRTHHDAQASSEQTAASRPSQEFDQILKASHS